MDHLDHLDLDIIYSYSNNVNIQNIQNNETTNSFWNYPFLLLKVIIFLIIFVLLAVGFLGEFCQTINYSGDSCFDSNNNTNIKNTTNVIFI